MDNKVLAKVNGREITENDMQVAMSKFPAEKRGQFYSEEGKKQLLDHLISFELIYNDALEKGLEQDETYLSELETYKKEILTQVGITKILAGVTVTDQEVEDYYTANKANFKTEGAITAKHILVETEEKAAEIRTELENGKDFAEAAEEYSMCPSKAEGGSLGQFSRGQMVPEFENAAYSLEVGVLSEPIRTQFGVHIIKVEGKQDDILKSFDEVKDSIKNNLLGERHNFKFLEYSESLKSKYYIEVM